MEDDVVLSKKQGGEWGIEKLPVEYRTLIEKALGSYQNDVEFLIDDIAHDFVDYMLRRINEKGIRGRDRR